MINDNKQFKQPNKQFQYTQNNKQLKIRNKHLNIISRFKYKTKLEKETILEEIQQKQLIKEFTDKLIIQDTILNDPDIPDITFAINKEKVIDELKLVISYDKINMNDINQPNNNCIIC